MDPVTLGITAFAIGSLFPSVGKWLIGVETIKTKLWKKVDTLPLDGGGELKIKTYALGIEGKLLYDLHFISDSGKVFCLTEAENQLCININILSKIELMPYPEDIKYKIRKELINKLGGILKQRMIEIKHTDARRCE
jgi:hypothetical protein